MKLMKITVIDGNWVVGTRGKFKVEAKIFTDPSEYGIDNGRVSKLWISWPGNGECWVAYERGWDRGEDLEAVWRPIVAELEKFAQSKRFLKSFAEVK